MVLKGDLAKLESENDLLKNELKRLSKLTTEKILDLENNINGIGMLKEHEGDNFEMEKNKVITNRDSILEQMKTQFNERTKKFETETRGLEDERNGIMVEIKTLQEELRNFKFDAEHRWESPGSSPSCPPSSRRSRPTTTAKSRNSRTSSWPPRRTRAGSRTKSRTRSTGCRWG